MKIAIRMGHMLKADGAAVGLVKEYDVIRAYAPYMIAALQRAGIEVVDVTPSEDEITLTGKEGMYQSLGLGVDKANKVGARFLISDHANWFNDPDVHGATGYANKKNPEGVKLIQCIIKHVSNLGFVNRGYMDGNDLYEINNTNMTAVIVEPFFTTNQDDVDTFNNVGPKALGEAVAMGVLETMNVAYVPEPVISNEPCDSGIVTYQQVYGGNLEVFFKGNDGSENIGTIKFDSIVRRG